LKSIVLLDFEQHLEVACLEVSKSEVWVMRMLFLAVLLGVGMTLAQGLTRKEQAALSGVLRDLDRIERNLANIMDSSDPETRQKRLSTEGPKIEKLLKDTKTELDALPASNADVAAQIVRHGQLSAKFLEVSKNVTGGSQAATAAAEGWDAYIKTSQYRADQDFLKSTEALLERASGWFTAAEDVVLMGNPNNQQARDNILALAKDTARIDKVLQEMFTKYTNYGKAAQRDLFALNATRDRFAKVVNAQTEFKAKAPNAQQKFAVEFNKLLAADVAAKNWGALSDLWGKTAMHRSAVMYLAAVYKALEPTRAVPMETVAAKVEETYKSTLARVAADVIANNKPPKDTYTGADIAAVKSAAQAEWKKVFPNYQILGVRVIDTEWSRSTGLKWDDFEKAWVRYDFSDIDVMIVVKWDNKYAAMFTAQLTKQHMKNDALLFRHQFNPSPNPTQLVLVGKL
jgi:hypothetical protein